MKDMAKMTQMDTTRLVEVAALKGSQEHKRTHGDTHTHTHTQTEAFTHVRMHGHTRTHTDTHTYTHTHSHTECECFSLRAAACFERLELECSVLCSCNTRKGNW